ncbi:MAG: ribosome recycling factor [Dehalococcoidia bacterium]|jgi:ribosome recycling factor|nr:MAG: ribosome recycling factor [Dehalococcoidia bacterium]
MIDPTLLAVDGRMQKTIEALKRELNTIRTGRATPALVEYIKVDAYGVSTPLNQIATISVPEAKLLVIQPWDRSTLASIQKAILQSDLGLNPINDGTSIRLVIPPPTEERRKDLVKVARRRVEEARVTIRNLRREAMEELKRLESEKEISQDENKRALDRLQKLTDSFIGKANEVGQDKEAEIMEI